MRATASPFVVMCLVASFAGSNALAQGISRVSLDTADGDADGASASRSISSDGRYVAFASDAADLVASDGNGLTDIFVRDRINGTTVIASVDLNGSDSDGASTAPALSADGRFVAFVSAATDLVAGDGNGKQDVFLRDLVNGVTTLISVDSSGGGSDDDSSAPWVDEDGDVVAFASLATDLVAGDTNNWQDVFVRDLTTDVTTRVSVDSSGIQGNNRSVRPTLSHDGLLVAFGSQADNLVPSDGNSRSDVFVHDRATAVTIRASVNNAGFGGNGNSGDPEISGDGTKVVFDSLGDNLVSGDGNGRRDVFMRDLATSTTSRLSVDDAGVESDEESAEASTNVDGTIVAFVSRATNLDLTDLNGLHDVYVRYVALGVTRRISLSNLGVEADASCTQPEISADGHVVSFDSAAGSLDPSDLNGFVDVFAHADSELQYTEFGVGLAGTGGFVPYLYGDGGSGFHGSSIHIRDGVGFANGILWVGLGTTNYQIYGGDFYIDFGQFFVPLPVLLEGVVGQGGEGELDFDVGDISIYSGFSAYLQLMLLDPLAVKGISFSNALQMDFIAR